MEANFVKMRVCESDVILFPSMDSKNVAQEMWSEAARRILFRRKGIGGDRLLVLEPGAEDGTFKAHSYTATGEGGACIDAALVAARYLCDHYVKDKAEVTININGNLINIEKLEDNNYRLMIGAPINAIDGQEIDLELPHTRSTSIGIENSHLDITCIRCGIPEVDTIVVLAEGSNPWIDPTIKPRNEKEIDITAFPISWSELRISTRIHLPLDLGTAAAACFAAAVVNNRTKLQATIYYGSEDDVTMEWSPNGKIFITAEPEYVCKGTIELI